MNQPIVYDKAKWHSGGEYPSGLDDSHSFIHTGMFLGWIIANDLLDPEFLDEVYQSGDEVEQFKSRNLTAPKLFALWDGALVDDMLNEEGNSFAQAYFDFEKGHYLKDYERLLAKGLPSMYHVEDTWENFDAIKAQVDKRFTEWKNSLSKKWWQFWK